MRGATQSTEQIHRQIEELNRQMSANHEAFRAGNISREEYRRVLQSQRDEMRDLRVAYDRAIANLSLHDALPIWSGKETDELSERIKSLSEQVRTQRNLWAARISDDEQFRQSTEALHKEMRQLYEAGGMTGDQMRKLSGDLAYAQRGLDSVNNVASRGGLAWTAQIGIADALGKNLQRLGPAGAAAAQSLSLVQRAFRDAEGGAATLAMRVQSLVPLIGVGLVAAVGAAVGMITRFVNQQSEFASVLVNSTERLNTTIEGLQALQFAAGTVNISMEQLDGSMQSLARRAASAADGTGPAVRAYQELGISVTDASGRVKDSEVLLHEIADAFGRLEDPGKRAAYAYDLFNRSGTALIPLLAEGSEGLSRLRREAEDLGAILSADAANALNDFSTEFGIAQLQLQTLARTIAADFTPVLREDVIPFIQGTVIPVIRRFAETLRRLMETFQTSTGGISDWAATTIVAATNIGVMTAATRLLATGITSVGTALGIAVPQFRALTLIVAGATGLVTWLASLKTEADRVREAIDSLDGSVDSMRTALSAAQTGIEQLDAAMGEAGLRRAVQTLAGSLDEDGREAFVNFAEQAIASGEDVERVIDRLIAKWAEYRLADAQAELSTAQRELNALETIADRRLAQSRRGLTHLANSLAEANAEVERWQNLLAGDLGSMQREQAEQWLQEALLNQQTLLAQLEAGAQALQADDLSDLNLDEVRQNVAALTSEVEGLQAALAGEGGEAADAIRATIAERIGLTPEHAEEAAAAAAAIGRSINDINEEIRQWQEIRDASTDAGERQAAIDRIKSLEAERNALLGTNEARAASAAQARTTSEVITGMYEAMAVAAAREAHNIAVGMSEAEARAIRLGEELSAVQGAYNTLLTGVFDQVPGDGLLVQLRQQAVDLQAELANLPGTDTAAVWASRLGFEMAEGLKTPIQVIRILSPRLQELIAERDELLNAGRYNTTAYQELEADIQAITTTVDAARTAVDGLMTGTSFPQPDEGEGLSELARQAYEAEQAALALADAQQELADSYRAATPSLEEFNAAFTGRAEAQEQAAAYMSVARAVQEVDKAQREALLAAERNSKVLAAILSRNVGATTPGFQPPSMDEGQGSEHTDVWLRLREDMKLAEAQASALGDQFDLNAAQSQAISRALTALLAAGVDPLSVGVQNLVADLADLAGAAEAVRAAEEAQKLLESLTEQAQQTTDARRATEQLRDALVEYGEANADAADEVAALSEQLDEFTAAEAASEAQEQFEALLNEIEGIAREANQFSDLAARVEEVATAADLSEDQVSQLHAAIADAEARTEVQELADAVTDAEDRIRSLTGTGETEFSVLRTILETARDELLKLGEDVTHVDALLKQLGEAEAASNLTTALGTVRGAFQQIGSAAGGALGEAITGIGDMIDIAMKFASGDVAGAVIDVFAEIVRAISEVINANENWRRSLDDLAARNKMLSKDVTDAIVVSRDETVRLWGWLPIGTKKVVEQAATDQAIGWANAFANAAASALASTDLFGNLELGLDRIVRDELIRGFTQSAAMSAAIIEVVQLFQQAWEEQAPVMRDQLLLQGRAAFAGLEEEFEEFWNWLQETFPELYGAGASSARSEEHT